MSPVNEDDARFRRVGAQLRAAVQELAAARPAETITVSELTAAAGVSRAVFYRHAASPAELLAVALIEDLKPSFDALADEMGRPGADYAELWRRVYMALLDHVRRREGVYRVLTAEPSRVSRALEAYFEAASVRYVGAVVEHLAPEPPPTLWSHMAVAQAARDMMAVITAWVRTDMVDSPELVVDTYLTLAPPWQLAKPDAAGRITLRRGRGRPHLDEGAGS